MSKVEKSNHPAPKQRGNCSPPLAASPQARRQAAAILEVLAGVHRPTEAAQVLGTSLVRYYQLERRALLALVAACEPAPRGPRLDPARRITALEREHARLEHECDRQRALVRAAERALGLSLPSAGKSTRNHKEEPVVASGVPRRRARRPSVRALRAVQQLRTAGAASPAEAAAVVETGGSVMMPKGSSQQ
jgi:hypothetical protein